MTRILLNWIISAVLLLVVASVVPGFVVKNLWAALWAALAIGLINATLGLMLKVLTFPLTILTFGIFLLVINALMLMLASHFVPGFYVSGFGAAFWGAVLLMLLHLVQKWLVPKEKQR